MSTNSTANPDPVAPSCALIGQDTRVRQRRIIGITGCPGSGKSTIAARMATSSPHDTVVVPMDGFHLAQAELERLGRADRKGAPDTFDPAGYVALLTRVRDVARGIVYAPAFDRHLEEPIAGAIAIEPHHTIVITEGNYLLVDHGGWEGVRPLLDECRYVECDDDARVRRLIERHVEHGRSRSEASAWVSDIDEPNARLISATRSLADLVVRSDVVM